MDVFRYGLKISSYVLVLVTILKSTSQVLGELDCYDNISCKQISDQIFEVYCEKTTLKTLCPIRCNTPCVNKTEITTNVQKTTLGLTRPPTRTKLINTITTVSGNNGVRADNELNVINGTVYVPLFQSGFVKTLIPTSSKDDCDFTKAKICKKDCDDALVWCPSVNEIPKEQIEIILNFKTDIHILETQGRKSKNETVTQFLVQYINENRLVNLVIDGGIDKKESDAINQFYFKPPIRTNYICLTPLSYRNGIAMRFELYSKGTLYNKDNTSH